MKLDAKTHTVDQTEAAKVIGVSTRRVRQLVAAGRFSPVEPGRYLLREVIAGYQASLIEHAARRRSPELDKLRNAQASQIEARIKRFDREHIGTDDAVAFLRQLTTLYGETYERLPRLITSNPRERERLTTICQEEKRRLEKRSDDVIAALKNGGAIDDGAEEEDD